MITIVGDIHIKDDYTKFTQAVNALNYIKDKFDKEENIFIFLGDIFDSANPSIDCICEIQSIFSSFKSRTIVITGNHDRTPNQNALKVLSKWCEIIDTPIIKEIENKSFLLMPHVDNNGNLYDFYNDYLKTVENTNIDVICHHLETDTSHFTDKFIDLSKFRNRCDILGGHVHSRTVGYLGSACKNSSTEKNDIKYIAQYTGDNVKYISLPSFLDYEIIEYPNEIVKTDKNISYTITKCPSKAIAVNYYTEMFNKLNIPVSSIHKYITVSEEVELENNTSVRAKNKSELEYLQEFANENKITQNILNKLVEVL